MYWTLIPCLPSVGDNWVAACDLIEGYSENEHSHWISPDPLVEVITTHAPGESKPPNCSVRRS